MIRNAHSRSKTDSQPNDSVHCIEDPRESDVAYETASFSQSSEDKSY